MKAQVQVLLWTLWDRNINCRKDSLFQTKEKSTSGTIDFAEI
jgi:hypothetical protein